MHKLYLSTMLHLQRLLDNLSYWACLVNVGQ
jgi:hypothetical protein